MRPQHEIFRATQINACLTCQAEILPKEVGDSVRPFRIGINNDFKTLLKPDGDVKALRQAITRYVRSKGYYQLALNPIAGKVLHVDGSQHRFAFARNGNATSEFAEAIVSAGVSVSAPR